MTAKLVGLADVKHIRIGVAGIATHGHDVGHHFVHGVDGAHLVAVRAVAKASSSFFLFCHSESFTYDPRGGRTLIGDFCLSNIIPENRDTCKDFQKKFINFIEKAIKIRYNRKE